MDSKQPLEIGPKAKEKVKACREYLDSYMDRGADPVYGVNTGFGSLCDTVIKNEELTRLQENLVKSHACGTGKAIPGDIVKMMMLFKIKGLSYGHSGVQLATLQRLVDMYNTDAIPVVYEFGSLGAS